MEPGKRGIIIVAGGCGSRMGAVRPKQFLLLGGTPVLARTINRMAEALPGTPIVVVLPPGQADYWHNLAARFDVAPHTTATGGANRCASVRNGLAALPDDCDLILVHDGVRPLVSRELILRTAACADRNAAAVPVVEPVDSYRRLDDGESHTIDRSRLRIVQTPQAFHAGVLRSAYENGSTEEFTDDASMVEQQGHAIFLCTGERTNLKITTREDLLIAEALLEAERERSENGTETDEPAGNTEICDRNTPDRERGNDPQAAACAGKPTYPAPARPDAQSYRNEQNTRNTTDAANKPESRSAERPDTRSTIDKALTRPDPAHPFTGSAEDTPRPGEVPDNTPARTTNA